MNPAPIKPFFDHLRSRGWACLRSPGAWVTLVFFGTTAVILWPVVPGKPSPFLDPADGMPGLGLLFFWLYFWTVLPIVAVRGRATEKKGTAPLGFSAAPALPVSPQTRAVAEASLALMVVGTLRWVAGAVFHGACSWEFALSTFSGLVFFFPVTVAWALPVRNPNTFLVRPILIVLPTGFALAGGVFASWWGLMLGSLGLTAIAIVIADLEIPDFRGWSTRQGANRRIRDPLDPRRQLSRDAWRRPIIAWGPWVLLSIVFFGVCGYIDFRDGTIEWRLVLAFPIFFATVLQPLMRPFNLNLIAEGLVGKRSVAYGDFIGAWSVLPVGRTAVLRRVWLHGVASGALIWLVPVTFSMIHHRLAEGLWSFTGGIGKLMVFVVVGALIIPIMAGALVAVAAGKKRESVVSGLSLLPGIPILLIVRVVLVDTLGGSGILANGISTLLLILLVAAGSLPPLRLLGGSVDSL